jgi:tetratricopeptide (TPR) repeat protein
VIDGDIGSLDDAENSLLAAKDLFEESGESSMAGKIFAQLAYIWIDANPEKSLRYLREARAIIAPDEIRLITLCEINRTDCLITLGLTKEALLAFSDIARLCEQFTDPFVQLRLRFLEGRLLEVIERYKEADIIFREVIAADLDQRSIKAYFLDLAYLFGSYVRRGDGAGAVGVCNEELAQIDILELGNSAEEPIRDLWEGLKERAERGAIKGNLVERSRKYIRSQWSFLGGDPLASKESAVK